MKREMSHGSGCRYLLCGNSAPGGGVVPWCLTMTVPPEVEENFEGLSAALSAVVPPKDSSNLLIET
jgi:hypothetical protein